MRRLSSTLLAAQEASSGSPYITMVPGVGATVLLRNPSSGDKLNDLFGLIVDSTNPGQLFGVGFGSGGTGGSALDAWLGKLDSVDLDITSAKSYNDSGQGFKWFDVVQDTLNLYMVGMDFSGSNLLAVGKYLKSDLSKVSTVKWVSADSDSNYFGCGMAESGAYVYVAARTSEGATTIASYIAELNKSDLSINADYYSQQAAGGLPDSEYFQVECDGVNVFACGYETGRKAIVDKFDVAGLGNPTGKVITYGTSVTLYGLTYDDTHLYVAGYDDLANDVGVVIKLLKSDLSVVAAASYTDDDGSCRFNDIISDNDFLYAVGASYNGTRDAGVLVKINKSDLSIDTQLMQSDSTPSEIVTVTQDGGNIYTGNGHRGQSGSPAFTGHRSVIKWNKAMLTTGTSGAHTIATAGLTKATISPTIAATTRVLTTSADSHSAINYTEAASGCLMNALITIGAAASGGYDNTNRILSVIQQESPFEDRAEILLDNSDQVLSTLDMSGVLVNLGFGFGSEASYIPDLYVEKQEDISYQGRLLTRLLCIGNWNKLAKHRVMGDAIGGALNTGTDTVAEIIVKHILSNMELLTHSSDGNEDTVVPGAIYEVNTPRRQLIRDVIGMTGNLLKMRGADVIMIERIGTRLHYFTGTITGTFVPGEPVTSNSGHKAITVYAGSTYVVIEDEDDSDWSAQTTITGSLSGASCGSISAREEFDYKYGPLAGSHSFYEFTREQNVLEANRVICVDVLPDISGTTTYTALGEANDTTDQAKFGILTLPFEDSSTAGDNGKAAASAAARLLHIQAEATGGMLVAPMNVAQEMYDIVEIDDDRGGWTSGTEIGGRVGSIIRRYSPGTYEIELKFGGLVWDRPEHIDVAEVIEEWMKPIPEPRGPQPPPKIPEDKPWEMPTHHKPPVVEHERPTTKPTANLPGQRITGFLGGQVSQEKSDEAFLGTAKKIFSGLSIDQMRDMVKSGRLKMTDEAKKRFGI